MKHAKFFLILLSLVTIAGCEGEDSTVAPVVTTPSHLEGAEALVHATRGGDLETVKQILGQLPDLLHAEDYSGNTLLHMAGAYNRPDVVAYLINQGADPSIRNFDGETCFEHADSENADRAVLDLLRP